MKIYNYLPKIKIYIILEKHKKLSFSTVQHSMAWGRWSGTHLESGDKGHLDSDSWYKVDQYRYYCIG